MVVVRVYESLSTTATCVLSSLPPCHYVHVGACECACMCAILSTKISGRCDNIYILEIYIYTGHIETVARYRREIERISKSLWCFLPHKFIRELDFLPLKFW